MTDRPILFSAPMVRALLDGRKNQTRRVLSLPDWTQLMDCTGQLVQYERQEGHERHGLEFVTKGRSLWNKESNPTGVSGAYLRVPVMPGDRLYVREAHYMTDDGDYAIAVYAEDDTEVAEHNSRIRRLRVSHLLSEEWAKPHLKLRPSIHMPRWASRMTLTVTDVRVQRLQEISEADAIAEGVTEGSITDEISGVCEGWSAKTAFRSLWEAINGPDAWDANPWVVALTFDVHLGNIDGEPSHD
jgi:hypothetical protein